MAEKLNLRLVGILPLLVLAQSGFAGDLYSNDFQGNLYQWNRSTNVFDYVSSTGVTGDGDIAWNPATNLMYASNGSNQAPYRLYSVDHISGTSTLVGNLIDNGGANAPMLGLDYSSSVSSLYGFTPGYNGLHHVNASNAQTLRTSIFNFIVYDYTFDAVNNRVLGLGAGVLYDVNVSTGAHTSIGTLASSFSGIQYDEVTQRIMAVGRSGLVAWLDPSNNYAQTSIYNSGRDLVGMTAVPVPEPASCFAVGAGFACFLKRRRKS